MRGRKARNAPDPAGLAKIYSLTLRPKPTTRAARRPEKTSRENPLLNSGLI
jgi:hypothetical protein